MGGAFGYHVNSISQSEHVKKFFMGGAFGGNNSKLCTLFITAWRVQHSAVSQQWGACWACGGCTPSRLHWIAHSQEASETDQTNWLAYSAVFLLVARLPFGTCSLKPSLSWRFCLWVLIIKFLARVLLDRNTQKRMAIIIYSCHKLECVHTTSAHTCRWWCNNWFLSGSAGPSLPPLNQLQWNNEHQKQCCKIAVLTEISNMTTTSTCTAS